MFLLQDMFYLTLVTLSLKSVLCRPIGGEVVLFAQDSVHYYCNKFSTVIIR